MKISNEQQEELDEAFEQDLRESDITFAESENLYALKNYFDKKINIILNAKQNY